MEIRYEVPSALPRLLDAGEVQTILVSSYDAIMTPGRQAVDGVCIGSRFDVESVRLFSRVPLDRIRTMALDSSSMTSNCLAKIVLSDRYGIAPNCFIESPDLASMLDQCDAGVLIGDKGMSANIPGVHVLDLGGAWKETTGLPFVWALWVGTDIPEELATILYDAPRMIADSDYEAMAAEAAKRTGLSLDRMHRYLSETIAYQLDSELMQGLETFARKVGDLERKHASMPTWIRMRSVAESR